MNKSDFSEEDIQRMFEENPNHPELSEQDKKLYQMVFAGLKEKPSADLSPDFDEQVATRAGFRVKSEKRETVLLIFGLVGTLLFSLLYILIYGYSIDSQLLTTFWDIKGVAIFSVVLIILVQLADQKLVRKNIRMS